MVGLVFNRLGFSRLGTILLLPVAMCGAAACGSEDPGKDPVPSKDGGKEPEDDGSAGGGADVSDADVGPEDAADAGDSGTTEEDAGADDAGSLALLPWREGNSWTYRVTADGVTSTKTTTVGKFELVRGSGPHKADMAYRVETIKGDDKTLSWQVKTGDLVVRYREQSFSAATGLLKQEEHWDPYKIHVDGTPAHTKKGASWLEEYDETKLPVGGQLSTSTVRDRWTVLNVDESVEVPAGTFKAIVFEKVGGTSAKRYWYVRGVGKVKESGTQVEELVSFEVTP